MPKKNKVGKGEGAKKNKRSFNFIYNNQFLWKDIILILLKKWQTLGSNKVFKTKSIKN